MRVLLPGVLGRRGRHIIVIMCATLLVHSNAFVSALEAQQPAQQGVRIPADQLDALVAPIALYPDPLLSQTLVASTYPLEIIQLQQWLERNPGLKDKALVDAVSKQPWDPSVQAMAALPQMVKRLADDIQWTTDLGNAFLAQQSDVMDAVQRMRTKAQGTGALVSDQHQKVETKVIENKTVIEVEQAQPDVVYVPEYNPEAVYGPAVYPYPPIYYPAYTPGAVFAGSAISWGVGLAMGAAWGGGWGWGAGWGQNDIDMNFNNSFNRNANISGNRLGDNTWRHNPQHRGGAPYADRATANRFGSNTRGDSLANRQKGAQQAIARQKGNLPSVARGGPGNRPGGGAVGGNRPGGGVGGSRPGGGNLGGNRPGGGNLGGGLGNRGGIGNRPGGGNLGGAGVGDRSRIGGSDRIGNRNLGGSSFGDRGGFGGGSFNGSAARSSRSRGASSFGGGGRSGGFSGGGRSRGGGGGSRGGGGRSRGGGRR
jgi:Protein of unknown function (DUF3300)